MFGKNDGITWTARGAGLLLLFLCLGPVIAACIPLITTPIESLKLGAELITSERLWGLWGKTCFIALGTAIFVVLVGGSLGVLIERAPRALQLLLPILSTPLLLPAHMLAVAWIDVLGPQGILAHWSLPHFSVYTSMGVVLVQGLNWYPIPMLITWYRLRQLDPDILESARTLGTPSEVFRRVTLPLLLPALISAALFVVTLSLLSFSVPSLLQVPVFSVEIFTSFNSLLDQRQAVLLATPMIVTGLLLAVFVQKYVVAWSRQPVATQRTRANSGRWLYPQTIGLSIFLLLSIGLPCLALSHRIGTLDALMAAWSAGVDEILTSLLLAVMGASILILLVLPLVLLSPRAATLVLWTTCIAFLVSGPVFGVGLIQLWNHPGVPGFIYDRFPILLIAVVGRYALYAWLGCQMAMRWVPSEGILAARNLGASSWRVLYSIVWPQLRSPLQGLWACLFLLILGELECIVLIAPPGWVPLSLRIFTLMHYGPAAIVSALSLLQALVALGTILLFAWGIRSINVYTSIESKYHRERRR